jgi:hypothetical protein
MGNEGLSSLETLTLLISSKYFPRTEMTPQLVAKKYIGETEKPANSGFLDADFEARMHQVGFQKSQAWCSYFAELVFKEAYPERFADLDKLFNAGAVATFNNFKKAGYAISMTPTPGALVIWQNVKSGRPHWTGHAGIVAQVISTERFISIEGNTNGSGGREGIAVCMKDRTIIKEIKTGLKVLGFITI